MKKIEKERMTFTKLWVSIILGISLIDVQLTFVLAWFEKDTVVTLAVAIVTEIIAVGLGYGIKSFLGKKEEENNKLIEKGMTADIEDDTDDIETEEGEAEG